MRRRAKKHTVDHNTEFELDLAPLLAVMVKLVPVLLLSSAFVQMMIVETELPQVVQEAIKNQDLKSNTTVTVDVNNTKKLTIHIQSRLQDKEDIKTLEIIANSKGSLDLPAIHEKFIEVKKSHPDIFKISLNPESEVSYDELIKIMDEARITRDRSIKFEVPNKTTGKTENTNYLFPEVVFSNVFGSTIDSEPSK